MELFEIFPEGAEELGIQRSLSKAERDAIDDEDFAWPEEHKYPINTQAHLDAAAKLIGRAPEAEQAKIKARAIRIAKRKGFTLPESWQEDEGKDDKKEERATPAAANLSMYFPIVRTDADEWIVEGQATSEAIDSYGTIFEYESSKKAFQEWLKRGNIREQHDPKKAVGKALAVEFDDANKAIFVRARISKGARDTWEKILDGTLSGFSIGVPPDAKVKYVERGNNKRVPMYYDHRLAELSVVDAPGSPNCDMRPVVRADGTFTDLIDDVVEEEPTPETQPELAQPQSLERAGARVSGDTKSKMHTSIGHALHSVVGQMQNCGCEDCQAAMKYIDPDCDGDIDLGGYDDPDHDWQSLYNQSSSDEDMERKISGMVERALQPVYTRLQGIAGTLARVNGGASSHTSFDSIVESAINRAVEAANTAYASSLDEVRASLETVKGQVERIADTPVPGAPIMNAGAMPRPTVEKRLATDPYAPPARSGSAVYDAVAALSSMGQLDTVDKQVDALAAALAAQRRG